MKTGIIILIVISGVVLLTGLIVIIVKNKNNLKRIYNNLEKKFLKVKNNQLQISLNKVKKISENNEEIIPQYENLKERFETLSEDKIVNMESLLEEISNDLQKKGSKENKETLKILSKDIDELYKTYRDLEKEIDAITIKEKELREKLVPVKESFRLLKENFIDNRENFYDSQESFVKKISELEKEVEEIEKFLENGNYLEVEDIIDGFAKEVEVYHKHVQALPELISFATQIIPRRLEETQNRYDELKKDDYQLNNIKITNLIKEVNKKIQQMKKDFNKFEYDNTPKEIKSISKEITLINDAMTFEENSRKHFEATVDVVYKQGSSINKNFLKAKRDTQSIDKVFIILKDKKEELVEIEKSIQKLGRIKSDLDSFIHSLTKQPFSLLDAKMIELENFSNEVEKKLNTYIAYIKSLKDDSEQAFERINNYSIWINEKMNRISNTNHPIIIEKFDEEVSVNFNKIAQIKQVLKTKPIDVKKVNEMLKGFVVGADNLHEEMKYSLKLLKIAQEIIVFANRYRSSFSVVNDVLKKAELHYQSGEFEFAIDSVSEVLKEVHPKAYEEMLKSKGVIDE